MSSTACWSELWSAPFFSPALVASAGAELAGSPSVTVVVTGGCEDGGSDPDGGVGGASDVTTTDVVDVMTDGRIRVMVEVGRRSSVRSSSSMMLAGNDVGAALMTEKDLFSTSPSSSPAHLLLSASTSALLGGCCSILLRFSVG